MSMIIRNVQFLGSVVSPDQPPPVHLPQIAFAGRSNVGKSSLINRVLGRPRRTVARVSASPGKTQALNFFQVNDLFCLVDLPGSGYARVPKAVRDSWHVLVRQYISTSQHLKAVVYLVDSRHPPTAGDQAFIEYLAQVGTPTLIAVTKVDKLKPSARENGLLEHTARALGVSPDQTVLTSARTGEGTAEVHDAMAALLATTQGADTARQGGHR